MKKAYPLAFTLALLALPFHAQTVGKVLKVECSNTSVHMSTNNTKATLTTSLVRYISPDGTVRTETIDTLHHRTTVELSNESEDYQTTWNDETKMATRVNGFFHSMHSGTVGTAGKMTELGKASIQGFSCQGYSNSFPNGTILKHWVCTDTSTGATFPGRIEVVDGDSHTEQTIVRVTRGLIVPTSAFEPPNGYALAVTDAKNGLMNMRPR